MDKISILKIKKRNISDKNKLFYIGKEFILLEDTLSNAVNDKSIDKFLNDLIEINSELWKMEDNIRDCERNKLFDQKFIDIARQIYFKNDLRAEIKLNINNHFGSKIIEVKSYEKY